jgi:hypothetical protein
LSLYSELAIREQRLHPMEQTFRSQISQYCPAQDARSVNLRRYRTMRKFLIGSLTSLLLASGFVGCANMNPAQKGAAGGAALGAGVGAVTGGSRDALVGGGLGALGGAIIGHQIGKDN